MQGRHKDNLIPGLQLIRILAFEFPVRVIDQDQDSGSSTQS